MIHNFWYSFAMPWRVFCPVSERTSLKLNNFALHQCQPSGMEYLPRALMIRSIQKTPRRPASCKRKCKDEKRSRAQLHHRIALQSINSCKRCKIFPHFTQRSAVWCRCVVCSEWTHWNIQLLTNFHRRNYTVGWFSGCAPDKSSNDGIVKSTTTTAVVCSVRVLTLRVESTPSSCPTSEE